MKEIKILGIKVNPTSYQQVVKIISRWLKESISHYLVTPNPEIITYAQSDPQFKKILNSAHLSIPDGKGLVWASKGKLKKVVTGTDLMLKICSLAPQKKWKIGLLGGVGDTSQKTASKLKKIFPNINIIFSSSGGQIDKKGNSRSKIPLPKSPIDILFVAFGFPKQEYWIAKNKNTFPAKVFIPVGGAFNYISGKTKRAPSILRKFGLEWLFRLLTQPWRFKRQLKAVKFFYLVLKSR